MLDGTTFKLAESKPERFTMIVFFRGHFCRVCSGYLPEIQAAADQFAERGVEIVLISSDNAERSQRIRDDWGVTLPVAHSLDLDSARAWGLFLTEGDPARPEMPKVVSEPGLFLIKPDGEIFYAALNSAPAGRPGVADMLDWLEFMAESGRYAIRGGHVPTR